MKKMTIQIDRIFEEKRKGYTPSIEVVAGILGCCWKKPCKNVEISKFMIRKNPKGSSEGNISEALSYLDNRGAGMIKNDPDNLSLRERKSTIDFKAVVDFLFEYLYEGGDKSKPVGRDEHDEEQKLLLVKQIKKNRQKTGEWFLKMFFNREVLVVLRWNSIFTRLKKYPESFPYLLLSSDLASMRSFGSSINQKYLISAEDNEDDAKEKMGTFLKLIYAEQGIEHYPEKKGEYYSPQEFMKALQKKQKRKKVRSKTTEKRVVNDKFYATLMSSFKSTIVTNYEKKDKFIRMCFNVLDGISQQVLF